MLIVGTDNSDIFRHLPDSFLFIDDDISRIPQSKMRRAVVLDLTKHSLNPLDGMDHKGAQQFADLVYSASPQGDSTLTVRNGRRALRRLVLHAPRLDRIRFDKSDAEQEAKGMVDDLLSSLLS